MKKKTLAAAMSLGALMAAGQVQADSILFPFYQSGNGATSFLTLSSDIPSVLHYIWNPSCTHEDGLGFMTPQDLIQQTVLDPTISGLDLPAAWNDQSLVNYSLTAGATGFMQVSNYNDLNADGLPQLNEVYTLIPYANSAPEYTLRGQLVVVNNTTGLVYGYKGLNNPSAADTDANGVPDGMQANRWDSIFTSHLTWDLTWYPRDVVTTSWYVLVTGDGLDNTLGWGGVANFVNLTNQVWNRDEQPRSGPASVRVTCNAQIPLTALLTTGQQEWTAQGGYMWEGSLPDLTTGATGALAWKIEQVGNVQVIGPDNAWPNIPY
jgi:hypothetical protein